MKITKSELKEMIREALREEFSKKTAKLVEEADRTMTNVFGETFTLDEWDDYLDTDKAQVDRFVMVANGELDLSDLPETFYEETEKMAAAWNKYKYQLPYSKSEQITIENKFDNAVDSFLDIAGLI